MNILNNIDVYPKILVALTGVLAAFIKIRESFSIIKRKQELKLDLEIYEHLKRNPEIEIDDVKNVLQQRVSRAFQDNDDRLTNFFVGLVVFVGFGLWSIDIYQSSDRFNGWIILTAFCSLSGFSMLFGSTKSSKTKEVFYKIGFFDKTNFQFGFVITALTAILTPIMFLKMGGFSFWQFPSGLFFIIGLLSITRNIRRIG